MSQFWNEILEQTRIDFKKMTDFLKYSRIYHWEYWHELPIKAEDFDKTLENQGLKGAFQNKRIKLLCLNLKNSQEFYSETGRTSKKKECSQIL